MLGHLRIR